MNFKDMVKADVKTVVFNVDEFGTEHMINGRLLPIIIDNDELLNRQAMKKLNDDGIFRAQILFYVSEELFGNRPPVKARLNLDGENYIVQDSKTDEGVHVIILEGVKANGRNTSY